MPQKKRTKKTSSGTAVGARPNPQTPLALVLLGKGAFKSFKPLGTEVRK